MNEYDQIARFEHVVLPHLDAAYNLAYWLTHNSDDAADVVQESSLRAFRFLHGFHGGDSRAWLLAIVRRTCYTWLQRNRYYQQAESFDEDLHMSASDASDPELQVLQNIDRQVLRQAIEDLPLEFREVLVLREIEQFSYKEIALIVDVPIGTVMSRLARARKRLQHDLHYIGEEVASEL